MRRRKVNKKISIGSLLLLLAFSFYFACNPDAKDKTRDHYIEKPVTKAKKERAKKELRYLTVFTGKVTGIKDGDTFEVLFDGIPEKVRLAEIDCPENSQPFGKAAKKYASDLCFGKIVTVTSNGKRDRYKRIVGTITTADGVNINRQLIKAGLAWHYKDYSDNVELSVLEEEAREQRNGLWADKDPIAPWEWRRQKRLKKEKD